MEDESTKRMPTVSLSRRRFIAVTTTTVSGPLVGAVCPLARAAVSTSNASTYPRVDVARIDALKDDIPVAFDYPDTSSPALLLRLRQSATGGIGPDNRIVAYSRLCTHKGCPVSYKAERKLFICPCHWSSFDPSKAGQMVIGQGSQALPQISLELNGATIQAVGVNGLIYGRETNVL